MKKPIFTVLLGLVTLGASADILTLEQCRELALENNKTLQMASAEKRAAYYQRKSAFTNYLPKINAAGGYMFTSREISLLNDEQKESLPHMGDGLASGIQQALGAIMQNPQLAPILSGLQQTHVGQLVQGIKQQINGVGQSLVDALDTDTRNAAALTLQLTQPIYMGGKIVAYNKIAKLAEQAADDKIDIARQDVLVEVDETYWQIVALTAKKELAESYLKVVKDLEKDVDLMIAEGVATKADGLSVKVKANQADVALIQVNNGLSLLKMLLCQIMGIDVETPITLADENALEEITASAVEMPAEAENWRDQRPELRALSRSAEVYHQKERLALAETLPTVALTGGYTWMTPGLWNGFEKKFQGLWNVGVMVKIPIVTWGDRGYKLKKAQAETSVARLKLDEVTEKVQLQIAQSRNTLSESRQRLTASENAAAVAEENLRTATLGLREGVIPVINVNQAQTAWLGARSELIAAKIDLKLAEVRLNRALGSLN
ncbi:MAG: TolC family protein [Bacteroides sp.]|nr:TolC family protein [Bacteroides sp.]MCM1379240.1 TolC family protein [Bacteroides sp.]MCM1445102.1 TolC family protein [Prevotella sp.]